MSFDNDFNGMNGIEANDDWTAQFFNSSEESESSDASSEPSTESEKNTPDYLDSGSDTDDQHSTPSPIQQQIVQPVVIAAPMPVHQVPKQQKPEPKAKKGEKEEKPKKQSAKKRKLNDESSLPTATVSSSGTKPIRGRKRTEDEKKRDDKRLQELSNKEFLTPEEIEEKKVLTNRKTASDSRKRKKQEKENFQETISRLQNENQQLRAWILLAFQAIPLIQLLPLGIPSFISPIMLTTLQSSLLPIQQQIPTYITNAPTTATNPATSEKETSTKKKLTSRTATTTLCAFAFLFCIFAIGKPFFFNSLFRTSSTTEKGANESFYLPPPTSTSPFTDSKSLVLFTNSQQTTPRFFRRRVFAIPADLPRKMEIPKLPSIQAQRKFNIEDLKPVLIPAENVQHLYSNSNVVIEDEESSLTSASTLLKNEKMNAESLQIPVQRQTLFSLVDSWFNGNNVRKTTNSTKVSPSFFNNLMKNLDVEESSAPSSSKISKIWKNLKLM